MYLIFNTRFCGIFIAAVAIILALASFTPRPAQAQFMTGHELARGCAPDSGGEAINRCLGYIAGVIDYHVVMQSLGTIPSADFCLPEAIQLEEAAIAVLAYLKNKPDQAGFIAAPAVTLALNAVYPCQAPSRPASRSLR